MEQGLKVDRVDGGELEISSGFSLFLISTYLYFFSLNTAFQKEE